MTDIEVIYSDLSRQKETLQNINLLKKTDVLFIIVWDKTQDVWSFQGRDYYGIKVSGPDLILEEWDEEDKTYVTKPLLDLKAPTYTRINRPGWIPTGMTIFTGIQVSVKEWADAQVFYRKVLDKVV